MTAPATAQTVVHAVPEERIEDAVAAIAALPRWHPRRIGLAMLQTGMTAMLPFLVMGMAPMQIAFAVALAGGLLARIRFHALPGFWFGVAFAIWQIISTDVGFLTLHYHYPKGIGTAYVWMSLFLAQVAFLNPTARRIGVRMLMIAAGCSTLLACAQFMVGVGGHSFWKIDPTGERFAISIGFTAIHLTQGFVMCLVALVFIDARVIAGSQERVQLWVGRGYALLAMVISGARLAYVAFAFGLATRTLAAGGRGAVRRGALTLGAALLVGGGVMFLITPDRLHRIFDGNDPRWSLWRVSATTISEHPWFGMGGSEPFRLSYNAQFARVLPGQANFFEKDGGAPHAHSSLLSLAADFGVPAALLYLAFLVRVLAGSRKAAAQHPRAWSLAVSIVVASLVAGLFEDIVGHSTCAFPTYVLAGLALSLCRIAPRAAAPHAAA